MPKRLQIDTAAFRAGLAERVRMVRQVRESNSSEVARVLGVSVVVWHRYESGIREMPMAALAMFCEFFEVCPRWIILGDPSGLNDETVLALGRAFPEAFRRYSVPATRAPQKPPVAARPADGVPAAPATAFPRSVAPGQRIALLDRNR